MGNSLKLNYTYIDQFLWRVLVQVVALQSSLDALLDSRLVSELGANRSATTRTLPLSPLDPSHRDIGNDGASCTGVLCSLQSRLYFSFIWENTVTIFINGGNFFENFLGEQSLVFAVFNLFSRRFTT